jgi:hypothetical protein
VRLAERAKVGVRSDFEGLQSGKPRNGGSLDDMMTDGKRADSADDAKKSSLLQIDTALLRLQPSEPAECGWRRPGCFRKKLRKVRPPSIRTAASSTTRALLGSRPVVSVSIATASMARSGAAPTGAIIGNSISARHGI